MWSPVSPQALNVAVMSENWRMVSERVARHAMSALKINAIRHKLKDRAFVASCGGCCKGTSPVNAGVRERIYCGKAGPFSVERQKVDLPFATVLCVQTSTQRSAGPPCRLLLHQEEVPGAALRYDALAQPLACPRPAHGSTRVRVCVRACIKTCMRTCMKICMKIC